MQNMINIETIEDYNQLESYYKNLFEEKENLKYKLNGTKHQLTQKLKRERYETMRSLRKKLEKLQRMSSTSVYSKMQDLVDKRKELYKKRDLALEELAKEQLPAREKLQAMEEECEEISQIIADINKFRENRTCEEYLNLVLRLLKEMGREDYTIKIFNKEFTYVGYGTYSDDPLCSTIRINGVVALVKNSLDISEIPEVVISYPEEHPEYYETGDLILFQKLESSIEENSDLLTEMTYISDDLPGMDSELSKAIKNEIFKEYKESLKNKKQKVNK